jgi:hypothetical protein
LALCRQHPNELLIESVIHDLVTAFGTF